MLLTVFRLNLMEIDECVFCPSTRMSPSTKCSQGAWGGRGCGVAFTVVLTNEATSFVKWTLTDVSH